MDAVLANSAAIFQELLGEGVAPARLGLIYNGVALPLPECDRFQARKELKLSNDTLVLVTVANLIGYKGHADLITALSQLRDTLPSDWVLCLVGRDDGIGESLKQQATACGIAAHIRFAGSVADVSPYLVAADIGVLPSHEEGFSNAILESMAAGLPMVVTAVGGNAEAIRDGEHGRVVPARNAAALAAAVGELAEDPVKRRAWGSAARARAENQFGIEQCAASYAATYRRLLAGIEPLFTPLGSGTRNLGES
jgi:glycosyltransferase involved in cell wall biosynthesis